jgi:adenylate kinase
MKNIIFVAAPAAGKGTQSDLLVKKYGYAHISTGDLLREEVASGSEFGAELKKIMESGSLVSDETVTELLRKRLECDDVNNGFILDGYPRNVAQAETLDKLLESLGKKVDVCISLDMDMDTALKRALGRISCPQCGACYNKYFDAMKPKEEGICDNCGSTLTSRSDDNEETFKVRFNSYVENTKPLLKYYEDKGILFMVDNSGSADNTFGQIESVINND